MVARILRGYSARRMETLGTRLRTALDASGLSQSEVARRIGVRSQTINQWLSGVKKPSRDNLMAFVEHTGANLQWLLYGARLRSAPHDPSMTTQGLRGRSVPLMSLRQVVDKQQVDSEKRLLAYFPCGERAQAFVVVDDANAPDHPAGTVWIVDPDEAPRPGDMVVAAIGPDLEPVLGRYRVETTTSGRATVVQPINPDWPAARSDLEVITVIAVMTESIKPRRRD